MRWFVVACIVVATACTKVESSCDLTCENGGICSPATGTCMCAAGFEGDVCEVETDECAGNPCENGGTCADGIGEFTCTCAAGFFGAACEVNLDDCAGNPCLNGGTCVDGIEDFSCSCPAAFAGKSCQVCAPAVPTVKDFKTQGSFAVAKFGQTQVTITGSANVNVLNFNGLGIVGGNSDNTLDGNESMTFTFVTPVSGLSYDIQTGTDLNANGTPADATVEAFGETGASLGTVNVSDFTPKDLSTLFDNALISKFVVTANVDTQRIDTLTFNACAQP